MAAQVIELIKTLSTIPKVAIACILIIFLLISNVCIALAISVVAICRYRRLRKRDEQKFTTDMVLIRDHIDVYKEIKIHEGQHQAKDDDPPNVSNVIHFSLVNQSKKDGSNGGMSK